MEPLVEIKNLSIRFPEGNSTFEAVKGISFSIGKGEIVGVVGESGSGKSMSALALMGLLPKDAEIASGSLCFQGEDLVQALSVVGLPDPEGLCGKYPHELSGGMRQRVMIAQAMINSPSLLIADEPTTALDCVVQAQILELLRNIHRTKGTSILFISHDLNVVRALCSRVIVVYKGEIVEEGQTEDVLLHPKHEYTKGLIRSIPRIDTKEHERLVPIEGSPVDLLNPPKGCPFAPRCEKCMKICLREMPPVTNFGEVHYTQCWLNQKEEMEKGAANE